MKKDKKDILNDNIKMIEERTGIKRKVLTLSFLGVFSILLVATLSSAMVILKSTFDDPVIGNVPLFTEEDVVSIPDVNGEELTYAVADFDEEAAGQLASLSEENSGLIHAGRYDEVPKGSKYDKYGLPVDRKWLTASEWQGKHLEDPLDKSIFKAWKLIHVNTFLDYIKNAAIAEVRVPEYKLIPASLIAAQAIVESQFGVSRLSADANNIFGHKCHSCNVEGEYIVAHDDAADDRFHVKHDKWASIRDHSKLLMSKYYPRIPDSRKANPDIKDWLDALCNCGRNLDVELAKKGRKAGKFSYATSCYTADGYAKKIMSYIKLYKLDEIDGK